MNNTPLSHSYHPKFLRLINTADKQKFIELKNQPGVKIYDTLLDQLKELIKLRNPHKKLSEPEYAAEIEKLISDQTIETYGTWVYYEWNQNLVHTLNEPEFIEVRTSRNQYKITKHERDQLSTKRVGIVGLSVGQSIALTMAIERICGELRLADFDTLELSNLNRLRSGIQNLGLPKVIIAAREIAEIDPYLRVTIFPEGLTEHTFESFFGEGDQQLDLLVEVCDGLDIKIQSRYHARNLGIPVVMDTNDKGMIDIERFDLEPDRPILHGLAGNLNPDNIKNLTNEEKIPYILQMVGSETISPRLKASMLEIEQTLNTWPQLASSVQLGGAATTDVCRRILLNQLHVSGRFYIDLDTLIADPTEVKNQQKDLQSNPHFPELDNKLIHSIATTYFEQNKPQSEYLVLPTEQLNTIIETALQAPSAGNNQPWKWFYQSGRLLLLHDRQRSWSWGDYKEMGALMSLGMSIDCISLKAATWGYKTIITYTNPEKHPFTVAEINFIQETNRSQLEEKRNFAIHLSNRHTNRNPGTGEPIESYKIQEIANVFKSNNNLQFTFIDDKIKLTKLGEMIANCDRIRLLTKQGHEEFFHEVRWNHEQALKTRDGIELASVDLTEAEKAAFGIAKDYKAIEYLYNWNLGQGFKRSSTKAMETASGFCIVSATNFNRETLLKAGESILRAWIMANRHNLAVYPMLSPAFFINRLVDGKGDAIPVIFLNELKQLHSEFQSLCQIYDNPLFMFRLTTSPKATIRTLRMDKQSILFTS